MFLDKRKKIVAVPSLCVPKRMKKKSSAPAPTTTTLKLEDVKSDPTPDSPSKKRKDKKLANAKIKRHRRVTSISTKIATENEKKEPEEERRSQSFAGPVNHVSKYRKLSLIKKKDRLIAENKEVCRENLFVFRKNNQQICFVCREKNMK